MSRKSALVIILVFVLTSIFPIAFRLQRVEASGTILIGADGSIVPSTANITSTDNITYTFIADIYDEIEIQRDNITLDGDGYMLLGSGWRNEGILLDGVKNVTIRNMEIKEFAWGIYTYDSSNITISGNNITNNDYGAQIYRSSNSTISGNYIAKNQHGIRISQFSNNNTVSGNQIAENKYLGWANGIYLETSSHNNVISGNNITNNYNGIMVSSCNNTSISGNNVTGNTNYGIYLIGSFDAFLQDNLLNGNQYGFGVDGEEPSHYLHSINTSNLVEDKPIYYLISQHDITINFSTYPVVGFLALINSTNITVEGQNLTNNGQGLLLAYTNNSRITKNNITNNYEGIVLYSSFNNSISGNNVTNNSYGIYLQESSNNTIYGNNIVTNTDYGIELEYSLNNTISENNITENKDYGIQFDESSNNVISRNNITKNNEHSIELSGSPNNTIAGNNIANNAEGIAVYYSSNNTIYHNNFVNNTNQAYIFDSRAQNVWDDDVEGNYWSNYTGFDSDHDGIGETVNVLGTNNTDRYPLMGLFHSFNTSLGYRVNVISNSTIENFQYFESNSTIKMYVSNMTTDQTFGFCRVCIPKNLMYPPYTVMINDELTNVLNFNDTIHDNDTHRWIYFAYEHSTHEVDIIPEFPAWTSMLLILIVLTVAIVIYKWSHTELPYCLQS
jgi:parallel beta-helix repeat protein